MSCLHAITAVLLFLLVRQMTGRLWPSALVAALFAIHPLRVESVAWISERKDVLSGLFFVLTLGAYVRYVRGTGSRRGRYATVCLLYALGLLAKPMLVTLPMVLLLLDYWPLATLDGAGAGSTEQAGSWGTRCRPRIVDGDEASGPDTAVGDPLHPQAIQARCLSCQCLAFPWHLLIEKIPLLLLSAGRFRADRPYPGRCHPVAGSISWPARIANTLVAYVSYLGCFFWPQGLAILYPHPINGFSVGTVFAAAAVLAAVSAGVFLWRRQAPYLLVGWLWYLGMLVPVIGLLQVGGQSMADRYTYLPQIGLVLGLVWAATDLTDLLAARVGGRRRGGPGRFLVAPIAAAGIIAALAVAAWQQTGYWRDSETLWVRDMHVPEPRGPLQSRPGAGYRPIGTRRRSNNSRRPARSVPTTRTPCTPTAQSLEAAGAALTTPSTKYRARPRRVNEKSVRANERTGRDLAAAGQRIARPWHAGGMRWKEEPKNSAIGTQIAELLAAFARCRGPRRQGGGPWSPRRWSKLSKGKDPAALDAWPPHMPRQAISPRPSRNAQTALELADRRRRGETCRAKSRTRLTLIRRASRIAAARR